MKMKLSSKIHFTCVLNRLQLSQVKGTPIE